MGTSSNHASPKTPAWQLANRVLGNKDWSIDRQNNEIWSSMLADRQGRLLEELSDPLIAEACRIADNNNDPSTAMNTFNNVLSDSYASGLIYEVGKRALGRAVAAGTGSPGFAAELFAETVTYYVSRDLPSFIGASGRVQNITEAVDLKNSIRRIAIDTTLRQGRPDTEAVGWRNYVGRVLSALQSTGGQQ